MGFWAFVFVDVLVVNTGLRVVNRGVGIDYMPMCIANRAVGIDYMRVCVVNQKVGIANNKVGVVNRLDGDEMEGEASEEYLIASKRPF